jgi:cytochrome d ubiquinol oxidase subunit II
MLFSCNTASGLEGVRSGGSSLVTMMQPTHLRQLYDLTQGRTVHGANYVAMKTDGDVQLRARRLTQEAWWALVAMTILSLIATLYVRPQVIDNFKLRVWGWIIPLMVVVSLIAMLYFRARGKDRAVFLSSTGYIVSMLGGAAFAMYPYLLPATTDPSYSLTIFNSKTGDYSMRVGLVWWLVGITLAIAYFVFLYRFFRGKVTLEDTEGY